MNLLKNKGFCLLEIITGIVIFTLGFLLIGSLVSRVAFYTAKARLLSEAVNKAVMALDREELTHFIATPYDVRVERFSDKQNVLFYQSVVSWNFNGKREEISLVTSIIKEIRE